MAYLKTLLDSSTENIVAVSGIVAALTFLSSQFQRLVVKSRGIRFLKGFRKELQKCHENIFNATKSIRKKFRLFFSVEKTVFLGIMSLAQLPIMALSLFGSMISIWNGNSLFLTFLYAIALGVSSLVVFVYFLSDFIDSLAAFKA